MSKLDEVDRFITDRLGEFKPSKLTYEDDNRREFYTVNGDYLRIASNGELQRYLMGEWKLVKASDYPNALLTKLSELLNSMLADDYAEEG